jgi:hypothetical protein
MGGYELDSAGFGHESKGKYCEFGDEPAYLVTP